MAHRNGCTSKVPEGITTMQLGVFINRDTQFSGELTCSRCGGVLGYTEKSKVYKGQISLDF